MARVMAEGQIKNARPKNGTNVIVRGATQIRQALNKKPVDDATGKGQPHSLLGYSS
jgi:hypothetical protein